MIPRRRNRKTPDTTRDVAARLIPKGQFYMSGAIECAQFRLSDVQEAFGLTQDEMVLLVSRGLIH